MRVEPKTFDIIGVSSSELYFIARAYFDEGLKDRDEGYKTIALNELAQAKELFGIYGESYMVARCDEEIDAINEEM